MASSVAQNPSASVLVGVRSSSSPSMSAPPSHAASAILPPDEFEEEPPPALHLLCTASLQVVGIRYYTGVAHAGEYVSLVREPNNPYDRNAIRVDNLSGEKVGHVKATQAKVLAPFLDDIDRSNGRRGTEGEELKFGVAKVDGSIPRPAGTYTMPLHLELYGPDRRKAIPIRKLFERYGVSAKAAAVPPRSGGTKSPGGGVKTNTVTVKDWKSQSELDAMFDEQQRSSLSSLPSVPVPAQIQSALLPHQRTGLDWLHSRETNPRLPPFHREVTERGRTVWLSEITQSSRPRPPRLVNGGLLCDDMGMGKSLTTIALILSNPPGGRRYPEGADATDAGATTEGGGATESSSSTSSSPPPTTPTPSLAFDPTRRKPSMTAVLKATVGTLRALLETTAGRDVDDRMQRRKMKKSELVTRTMQALNDGTLSYERFWSAALAAATPPTPSLTRAPATTEGGVAGATVTLIVCPVSVASNWVEQIESHVKPGVLRVELYHGQNRHATIPLLQSNSVDIVLVSYQTLAADFSRSGRDTKEESKKRKAPPEEADLPTLFDLRFHRIVLDEAHAIRNGATRSARACLALRSVHRLGLTGTPLQNRPEDVRPLLSFLGVEPLGDAEVYRRAVAQPIRNGDDAGLARLRVVLCHVALRRSKDKEGIELPEKTVQITSIKFPENGAHRRIYDVLFQSAREAFGAMLRGGEQEALRNYMGILETLLRLRQACCAGCLVPPDRVRRAEQVWEELKERGDGGDGKPLTAEEGRELLEKLKGVFSGTDGSDAEKAGGGSLVLPECAVCLIEFPQDQATILKTCSHVFCEECIAKIASMKSHVCPLCRGPFEKSDIVKMGAASAAAASAADSKCGSSPGDDAQSHRDATDKELRKSPKVQALLESIGAMKPNEKGVVFSQFVQFLDVIGSALDDAGHAHTRIDGSMRAVDRIESMAAFNSNAEGSPRFILCSLLAAGTGINLTRGNHAFMMDLWWNKAVEDQAMDRIHRIGQRRDVRIVKFVMEGSIEERLVQMQDAKAAMGKGTMEKLSADEMRVARIGALKDLFQIQSSNEE